MSNLTITRAAFFFAVVAGCDGTTANDDRVTTRGAISGRVVLQDVDGLNDLSRVRVAAIPAQQQASEPTPTTESGPGIVFWSGAGVAAAGVLATAGASLAAAVAYGQAQNRTADGNDKLAAANAFPWLLGGAIATGPVGAIGAGTAGALCALQ
jgi:hypothetical protein